MECEIIPFNKEKHVPILRQWERDWRLPEYLWDCVPEFGFVALHPETKQPVAAMLLRHAEGNVVLIDHVITCLTSHRPRKTVDKLFEAGIEYGKKIGVKAVMAVSRVESLIDRAKEHGFETYPMTYLVRKKGF